MNKKDLSERDICTKYITPAVVQAGWNILSQVLAEVFFPKSRIVVHGSLVTRGKFKFTTSTDTRRRFLEAALQNAFTTQ